MQYTAVGHFLRRARLRKGLKQEVVAMEVHCDDSHISKLESGAALPSDELTLKLERAYALIPGELHQQVWQARMGKATFANIKGRFDISNPPVPGAIDISELTQEQRQSMHNLLESFKRRKQFQTKTTIPTTPNSLSGKSVLIVDDEAKVVYTFHQAISAKGIKVEIALNGLHALQKIKETDWTPTVILLDLRMPEMGGVAFLRELRKFNHDSKIVIMSAHADELARMTETGLRYEALLTKPVDFVAALTKLEELLGG